MSIGFLLKHLKTSFPLFLSQYVSALRPPKRPRQNQRPSERDDERYSTSCRKRVRSLTYERRPLQNYCIRTSPSVEEELKERRRWAGLSASCDRLNFSTDSDPDSVDVPETDAEEWKQVHLYITLYIISVYSYIFLRCVHLNSLTPLMFSNALWCLK